MKPVDLKLSEPIELDEREVARRKELFGLTEEDGQHLRDAGPAILEDVPAIVGEFYERQMSIAEVAAIIGDAETLRRLHAAQCAYVGQLFTGRYDLDYVNSRLRIGMVHKRIGVEPKYYFAAIKALRDTLRRVLSHRLTDSPRLSGTLDALDKVLCFDSEIVLESYMRNVLSELETARDRLARYAHDLEEQVTQRTRELAELSRTDSLTGLLNRRAFRDDLHRELARAKRSGAVLSLVCLDLDAFKQVNDTHGHHTGDMHLKGIGAELAALKREGDIASRYGGDEFIIALPDTDLAGARSFMDRLADRAEDRTGLTISFGIAQAGPERFPDLDELLHSADLAMYESKRLRTPPRPGVPVSPAAGDSAEIGQAERAELTKRQVEKSTRRTRRG